MRKNWIKKLTALAIFLISIFVVDFLMNNGNTEITMEMPQATLPVVSVVVGDYKVNTMHGYLEKREEALMKENITPITADREITISIDSYGAPLGDIAYEVRSRDGERLIEGGEVKVIQKMKEETRFSIQLKDLTDENTEYTFVTILTLPGGTKAYYYTRFIEKEEFYLKEKMDFILSFHETTFGSTEGEEIKKYLESSQKADNTSFHKVNINSSLKQVMWSGLPIKREGSHQIHIKDISESTAMVILRYFVSIQKEETDQKGFVEEYYRVRYTPNRMYLLDYERTLEEVFEPKKENLQNDKISLGITDTNITMSESEGGTNLAFVNCDRLFSYNSNDTKLTQIFSFYEKEDMVENSIDLRNTNRNSKIKILNVEDGGNITFAVIGYMNRGIHEGEVGVIIYYYDYMENTIEEMVYLPYEKTEDILREELKKLLYLNMENHLFFIMEGKLYDVDILNQSYEIVIDDLEEGGYTISESGRMICWTTGSNPDSSKYLKWMNLSHKTGGQIEAGYDEYVKVLGFMGEDLIYGLAKRTKVVKEENGDILFPIYKVIIKNEEEKTLKEYQKEGFYVVDCRIEENQITLERIEEIKEGSYLPAQSDHITSNDLTKSTVNKVQTATKEKYKTILQLVLKNTINTGNLKVKTPKEVMFETERELFIETQVKERFYVYGPYGMEMITTVPADAVIRAAEIAGGVTDESGGDIWKKEKTFTKNQIMAIEGKKKEENHYPLTACLDVILEYEGISRKTQTQLEEGETAFDILTQSLREERILNLSGCTLDSVLYYVDMDLPVLVLLENYEAYLIVGFNEQNVVLMDPKSGTVYKKGMNDSREMFEQYGNRFITYLAQ